MNLSELVFSVSESQATPLEAIDIASLQFLERQHLQEWVLQQPAILGEDILVITFEFDKWAVASGVAPKDRLDVLGIGADGRLVVAELKRGEVPDTVELQAIKYAAMVSRFDETQLARLHMDFLNRNGGDSLITEAEAAEKLELHVPAGISSETLMRPRIVILAEDFSATVTSSVVWLNEQSVDITLKQYRAYGTAGGETILTVSQVYPVAEVAAFEVRPRSGHTQTPENLPEIPWTEEDLYLLQSLPFAVPHAVLDLCSFAPGTWIGSAEAYEQAGVGQASGMGRLAGFGYSVRTRFKRSNSPWIAKWAHGGKQQAYYCVSNDTAERWLRVRDVSSSGEGI